MNNIIRIDQFKEVYQSRRELNEYKSKIISMQKAELLCELLEFHQLIKDKNLDITMTKKGISLMEVLMDRSLTPALKELAQKYHTQLEEHYSKAFTH